MVIRTGGVSGSLDDDTFRSVMADACKEAECQSPIAGQPLEKATTWVLLARMARKLEQEMHKLVQHHVLPVVQEWSLCLLAWLGAGLCKWCAEQVEPSTHVLLSTQPPGHGGHGPLLRSRLAVKKYQRSPEGMENRWCEVYTRTSFSAAGSMLHALDESAPDIRTGSCVRAVLRRQPGLNPES